LAHQGRGLAPGLIQLFGLPRVVAMRGEGCGHPQTVVQVHARYRHQILHRHVRGQFAFTHLLLHALGQQLHQRQPPQYPTPAAVEAPRQFVGRVSVTLLHLLQQPALLERRLRLGHALRTVQQQRLGLAHRPGNGGHGIAAQLLQRGEALVAVDDQIPIRSAGEGHDDDGRLLSGVGQRCQQAPVTARIVDPQVLEAPVQLMKFQLHGQPRYTAVGRASPIGCSLQDRWPGPAPAATG